MIVIGTVVEELAIQKEIQIEVASDASDEEIKEHIREVAYENTLNPNQEHGWEPIMTHDVSVDYNIIQPNQEIVP